MIYKTNSNDLEWESDLFGYFEESIYIIVNMQKISKEEVHNFMAIVESNTKDLITRIKWIDSQSIQKQAHFHKLGSAILYFKEHQKSSSHQCAIVNSFLTLPEAMEQLKALSSQIRSDFKEKAILSRRLYNMLADSCEQFQDFFNEQLPGQLTVEENSFLLDCLGNEQVSNIILDCQAKEFEQLCVCKGKEDGSPMIKCEGRLCKARWFHLRCVKISPRKVPKSKWMCSECQIEARCNKG